MYYCKAQLPYRLVGGPLGSASASPVEEERFSISERQLSSAVVSLGMDRRRIDCGTCSALNFSTEGLHCGCKGIREIAKQEICRSLRPQTLRCTALMSQLSEK